MSNIETKMPRLPVDVSDFEKLITGKYHFADKSLFIKEIIEDGAEVILITRPRRFGKTLTLSMLHHFLQITPKHDRNLFGGLAVSRDKTFAKSIKINTLLYLFRLRILKKLLMHRPMKA